MDPVAQALLPFPPHHVVQARLRWLSARQEWLERQRDLDAFRAEYFRRQALEVEKVAAAWSCLESARNDPEKEWPRYREYCLGELRRLIGAEAFQTGQMPFVNLDTFIPVD